MTKFLILHGTDATPNSNWFMWLKGVLIGKGHEVWLPQLPDSDKPTVDTYNKFLLANKKFTFDKDTVIIGHSSGAVEALSLLQRLPKGATIKAAILVAAFKDNLTWTSLDGLFTEPFDFEKINKNCPNFTFVYSDNDTYVPVDHAGYLARETDGKLIKFEGQGHFNTEQGPEYKKFPQLLDIIADVL